MDIALSPAGDRLYVLSSNDSGTLSEFRVTQEGLTPIKTTPAVGGDAAGLVVFDSGRLGLPRADRCFLMKRRKFITLP